MDPETLHIHKTHKSSFESLVFLVIPILLFTLVIAYFLSGTKSSVISQTTDEQTSVLGETSQNP